MHPLNTQALIECSEGSRLVFSTFYNDKYDVVTVPVVLTDLDLYRGFYLLIQDGFPTALEADEYMRMNGFLFTPLM